jgi:RimJ/RimL family protein N-acetyltransferase
MSPRTLIETDRLALVPLDVDLVDALIAGDAAELKHVTGAEFSVPLELPPLFDRDRLSEMRDEIDRDTRGENTNLLVDKETNKPVGIGTLKPAGDPATLMLGYSIYPHQQGKGYGTEAAQALIEVARRGGVEVVRATMPPDHAASIRVAEKVGMSKVGTATDAGEVLVFEISVSRLAVR